MNQPLPFLLPCFLQPATSLRLTGSNISALRQQSATIVCKMRRLNLTAPEQALGSMIWRRPAAAHRLASARAFSRAPGQPAVQESQIPNSYSAYCRCQQDSESRSARAPIACRAPAPSAVQQWCIRVKGLANPAMFSWQGPAVHSLSAVVAVW